MILVSKREKRAILFKFVDKIILVSSFGKKINWGRFIKF